MGLVTLLTDWGPRSPQLASLKGNILHENAGVQFVDLSHDLSPFDLVQASYIFKSAYRNFPDGTVHYIGIDASDDTSRDPKQKSYLLIKSREQFFIGPDSGFFSLVFDPLPSDMVRITIDKQIYKYHFNVELVRYISELVNGSDIYDLGDKVQNIIEKENFKPIFENQKTIRGSVIHVDDYGNVVTNIRKEFFEKVSMDRPFVIALRKSEYTIDHMHNWYDDVDTDEILAMFNASDHLEIAMNQGHASRLLGLGIDDKIRIDFNDN